MKVADPDADIRAGTTDPFLRDLRELEAEGGLVGEKTASAEPASLELALAQFGEALPVVPPPAALRERLLAEVPVHGRFARFAQAAAKLLDLRVEQAQALLDRIEDRSLFVEALPGISFFWVDGGPAVTQAVRGFVRVTAGTEFPEHEHFGEETVLVIQGSFEDLTRGVAFHPGDIDRMPGGSAHVFRVPADGPDLVKLSVTRGGLCARALGITVLPQ